MIGTKLADRYEILSELGRGGMGVVYRARDPLLDREVAVKVVPPALLTPDAELRFRREAQVVARMDHPAIVTVYDIGRHEGALYFVMPVVSGTTLRTLLRERSLRLGDVVDIGIQIAQALDYSHALGIVHRDIKPENVMAWRTEPEGVRVRIMDFGLAHASLESQLTRITQSGTIIGTVSYFSPEQVSGQGEVDARSDIYSLGSVLYEAMLGEPPFTGEVQSVLYRIVHEVPQPPTARGAAVDAELEAIAMRCIARDPNARYQAAREIADALMRYRSGLASEDRRRSIVQATTRLVRSDAGRDAVPLTGRDREIAELQHRLNAAIAGECQFVLVGGEAGIGKSRLLEELELLARARRIPVLHGKFVEQDRAFPYQGFCEAIQEYFRSRESGASLADAADFTDLAGELGQLFPVLAEIGDIRAASHDSRSLLRPPPRPRVVDRTAIFELLARALARIAGGRPLVLLFEDLHDADVSIEALQYIVRRLGPAPILIVGTYRSSEVDRRHAIVRLLDSFHGDRRFVSIQLGPLSPSIHRAFVEALGGRTRVTDALARALYEASEGNPFFTRELVRSLVDSGGVVEDEEGALSLSSEIGLGSDALPATIQQIVEKRIERLSERDRELLSIASVLGRSFEYRDLEALGDERHEVEEAVDRLLREGLLDEERESRGDRLSFASGVVRDALYAGLSRRRRRALHLRYAEWLERRHTGKDRFWAALAHHYSHADVAEKAIEYGLKAAKKSLEAFSAEEAIRTVKVALEFLEDGETEAERRLEGEARMLLAAAYRMDGNIESALLEAERAARDLERDGDTRRALDALYVAAETAWQGRRIEETRRWVERGIDAAQGTEHAETLARFLTLAATVANLRGEYETAREYLEEADALQPDAGALGEDLPRGGRLTISLAGRALSLDPSTLKTVEEEEIVASVFERLFTTDERGHLAPLLCERWEVLDGGAVLLLTLRSDAKFSDGHALEAEDVKRSFERALRLDRDAPRAALSTIRGAAEFATGLAGEVSGIVVHAPTQIEFQLVEPLPIYPALLSDVGTAIVRVVDANDGEELLGTGPFRVATRNAERVVLEPSPAYRGERPLLDALEFRAGLSSVEASEAFEAGQLDIARELAPDDLERLLRDTRLRASLAEAPRRSACFVVFNASSPALRAPETRRALGGFVRAEDLVWRTLGRFALPASGLIPPGMLGHDPGRRRRPIDRDEARALLAAAGVALPLRLRAAASPVHLDRYEAHFRALFELWAELGVEVTIETPTSEAYLDALRDASNVDLLICRWHADYDDPDNFTHGLFNSRTGFLREFFSSPETDRIGEEARTEHNAVAREAIYRRFENALFESGMVVPLFHEINYRLVQRRVRNLRITGVAPYINYAEVAKVAPRSEPQGAPRRARGGILQLPGGSSYFDTLEPTRISTLSQGEIVPTVFETLTRVVDGARVVPWLAESFAAEEGGRLWRFHLRDDVRFHDGRRLTSRDVRYSFERFLLDEKCYSRDLLAPIRGASAMIAGEAGDLKGFRILSSREFTLELETPLQFFAAILTNTTAAIVPEGSGAFDDGRRGYVGTGPFRVVRFDPGRRLELERNGDYWREGYPRSEGMVFTFGLSSEEIVERFRSGRLSIATELAPASFNALRHDPRFAAGYRETPRLSTACIAFNAHRGLLEEREIRRRVLHAIDKTAIVRRVMGRYTVPAHGLFPPGLLGHEGGRGGTGPVDRRPFDEPIELTAAANASYAGRYADLTRELLAAFRHAGVHVRIETVSMAQMRDIQRNRSVDMLFRTWVADYPDSDSFARGLLHSREGALGRLIGSDAIDALVERARGETESTTRHFLYRQIEEILSHEALVLPLFHPRHYRFARPEVEGLSLTSYTYPSVSYERLWIK
jgi:ABC-type transport system substrate-binding protein